MVKGEGVELEKSTTMRESLSTPRPVRGRLMEADTWSAKPKVAEQSSRSQAMTGL